ncbi:hypothetical protein CLV47_12326 [Antricoccus suffuscus]|uniref:Uncharacterized protein n=1 Tax=Antricoccus suffuscus TaxID=1629062 RepID=A0A2T0ZF48_9ACTN|nr:hypothetical protein [Antricoccus suffuscus]PRZ34794.1 hypothetical protein CLV47_12326 [Antricoccus suffuscus]
MRTADTDATYYLTAATMAYPRGRVLRLTADGTLAVHDQQQWRDLGRTAGVPEEVRAISRAEAIQVTGQLP